MTSNDTERDIPALREKLVSTGLSQEGILRSTGITRHLERVERGETNLATLSEYAAGLSALTQTTGNGGAALPVDFWDVRTPAMEASRLDEYQLVSMLVRPDYGPYLFLLDRCFAQMRRFKVDNEGTAVETALEVLCACAEYVRAGHCLEMTSNCRKDTPEARAIFLWQQLVTGTNRQIPYLHRDAYTHGYWERFNVVEMWRYREGVDRTVDEVWGLTGFAEPYIGDATNTNQIEHMTISAVAQMALGIPAFLLNLLEEVEWMLRRGTYAASKADERVNRVVARVFRPHFRLNDPLPACHALASALGSA